MKRTFFRSVVIVLLGAMLLAGCAATDTSLVSSPAPQFSLSSIDGKSTSLSDYRGKVVVLDFWATWCPTCRQRLSQIQALADNQDFASKGLVVLTIDEREKPSDIRGFVDSNKITLTVLPDIDGEVARAYNVVAFPTTFVVGRDEKIVAVITADAADSSNQLNQAVDQAMR